MITGLTRYATAGHLARAALESTAFQTRDVLDAMVADSGVGLVELRVDGGMTSNSLLMQFQADILGVDVVRPRVAETTALGAAYAAGLAVGVWPDLAELRIDCPRPLRDLVHAMLEKEPGRRPSIGEALAQLERLVAATP